MKYKNISGQDLTIIGVGIVKDGETREMPEGFNNANFEKVGKSKSDESDADKEIK